MTDIEYRVASDTWPDEDLAIRGLTAEGDTTEGRRFRGYAAAFGSWSEKLAGPGGAFRERIDPGAFARTLTDRKNRIRMFANHNTDLPLASTRSGTLTLTEDAKGLAVEATLPDTSVGRDLSVLIREGIVDSMSFGFSTVSDGWNETQTERTLKEVRLHEVSIVTGWPAYTATSASVRYLADASGEDVDELAEAFRVIRDPDARLTATQRDLLVRAINARSDEPVVGPVLSKWRTTFAGKTFTA